MFSLKCLLTTSILLILAGCPRKANDDTKGTASAATLQQVPGDAPILPPDVAVPAAAPTDAGRLDATVPGVDGGHADAGPL